MQWCVATHVSGTQLLPGLLGELGCSLPISLKLEELFTDLGLLRGGDGVSERVLVRLWVGAVGALLFARALIAPSVSRRICFSAALVLRLFPLAF